MNPDQFNIRHLAAMAAVVELGSVSLAARAVNLTQPAVTQGIAKLEAQLGLSLFARQPGGMVALEPAERLKPRIDAALRLIGSNRVTAAQVRAFVALARGGSYAAAAVATGVAKVVVVYRAMNERSWYRFGTGTYGFGDTPIFENVNYGWYMPHGFHTPAAWVGMFAQRYMHTYGATSEDFGRVAVAARDFAATNPQAFFHGKPITLEEHQASRWICEPLHLLDCCQESDGAVAMVITSAERARDLDERRRKALAEAEAIRQRLLPLARRINQQLALCGFGGSQVAKRRLVAGQQGQAIDVIWPLLHGRA